VQPEGGASADEAHDANVCAVALSADGSAAASASLDGEVRRWDVVSGRTVDVWQWEPRSNLAAVAIAGARWVAASGDGVLARDGAAWTLPDTVTGLSSDGDVLFAHVGDQRYRLDPGGVVPVGPGRAPTGPYGRFPGGEASVTAAAWSPAAFVTGHDDGTVRVWGASER
jgi:WD40 repeat protein